MDIRVYLIYDVTNLILNREFIVSSVAWLFKLVLEKENARFR